MELKEFVSQSIVEIIEGITNAQSRISNDDTQIVPNVQRLFTQSNTGGSNLALGWDDKGNLIHTIEFDVAVTATEGSESKSGIGVVTGVFGLGAQGKTTDTNQSISHLKFRIPISFPRQKNKTS